MSEQPQICPTCQRSISLTYYCESCRVSFCSDCIKEKTTEKIICSNCGSEELERNSKGILKCKSCFSQNISKVYKDIKTCPKCNSSKVMKVFEKKKEINYRFLSNIKNTRTFLAPFRGALDKLSLLRNKLKKARDPPVKCFHFPSLEAELITIYKIFTHVKSEAFENLKRIFNHIFLNKTYFVDIFSQPNDNIPIIEGILENLGYEQETLTTFIETNLKKIVDSLQEIENKLKFIEEIQNRFLKYCSMIEFSRNEKALYALKCKMTKGYNLKTEYSNKKGSLLISNFNIYFINEYGVVRRRTNLLFKISHDEFKRIKILGKIKKKLYMEFVYGQYHFAINSSKRNNVIDYIENARVFDENHIYDIESANSLISIKLNLKDLHDFIERNISYLINILCNQKYFNQSPPYHAQEPPDYAPNYGQTPNENYSNGFQRNHNGPIFNESNYMARKIRETQIPPTPYTPQQNFNQPSAPNSGFPQYIQIQTDPYSPGYQNGNVPYQPNSNPNSFSGGYEHQYDNKQVSYSSNNKNARLLEVQKEEYSLNQTLKLLDRRFDEGSISDVDYFKTYKTYQKDLYVIQRKIEGLKDDIDEEDSVKNISSLF